MTENCKKYAVELHELKIQKDLIQQTVDIFKAVDQIMEDLANPAVSLERKHNVIDKIFPKEIRDFLKVLCDNNEVEMFPEIAKAYYELTPQSAEEFHATLAYVKKPTDEQLMGIRNFLMRKFGREDMDLELEEDTSLGDGFVIRAGGEEFDWSTKGRMKQFEQKMEQIKNSTSTDGIISILKTEIENFDLEAKGMEIGVVKSVADGIANIDGIDHAMYGEIVLFDSGIKGMVQDIRRNEIGVILFGRDVEITEGSRVARTGKRAGIPVGDAFCGRVIDALGAPLDGQGDIPSVDYYPVEAQAPGIVDRKSVSVPMETGILAIDSMFPIGRGQRELIIGDRQTGKTSIAMDTIINQRGKGVICIYVAIGQKASTVAKLVNTLKANDALSYTIVVSSTASDPAPLQFIAPYSGTALAEYFMHQGKDVLIVYDDLSKHAVAYRAMSLLLERSPGREAYPGDVFYLHSRLLERSSRLSDALGGGSITALPIIETQAGDVSAYIPTNVISITDGQIFLESNLFFSGQRPAVNVGLSVSRVGGAAQTKAMKKAAGSVRIDLAQYREMEVFTQFASDLDDTTASQLAYGKSLMELLKQPLSKPLSMAEQVITLCAATRGKLMADLNLKDVKRFQGEMLEYFHKEHSDIISELTSTGRLEDETAERIVETAAKFKAERFVPGTEK